MKLNQLNWKSGRHDVRLRWPVNCGKIVACLVLRSEDLKILSLAQHHMSQG